MEYTSICSLMLIGSNGLFQGSQAAPLNNTSNVTNSNTTQTVANAAADDGEVFPKVLLAVIILAGAVIIGGIVAKIVDLIHDRKSLQDDDSDMSEYTRGMLKKRAIMAFKSKHNPDTSSKSKSDQVALKVGRQWSMRAKKNKGGDKAKPEEKSDIETVDKNIELLGYKQQREQINGGIAISEVSSTDCETGIFSIFKSPSDTKINLENNNERPPSLTMEEFEDDVFFIEQNDGKTVGSSSFGTLWMSEADTFGKVTKVADVELTPKSTAHTPTFLPPQIPKPDAWLYSDGEKSTNEKKDPVDSCRDAKDQPGSSKDVNLHLDEIKELKSSQEDKKEQNVQLDDKKVQNDELDSKMAVKGQSEGASKRSKIEDELDMPLRPSNPVPPTSPVNAADNSTPDKVGDVAWDEGVIYSYDESAKAAGNKTKKFNKPIVKGPTKGGISKRLPGTNVFTVTKQQAAKRPQTSKRPSGTPNPTGSVSGTGRPKTAGAGPIKTGNRPVSSKPGGRITQGVRLKSAKK